jgi:hypothetical protein
MKNTNPTTHKKKTNSGCIGRRRHSTSLRHWLLATGNAGLGLIQEMSRTISGWGRVSSITASAFALASCGGCCPTNPQLRGVIGDDLNVSDQLQGANTLWVCDEPVTLGWTNTADTTQASLTELGSLNPAQIPLTPAQIPFGSHIFHPQKPRTSYALECTGDCERTSPPVNVFVVQDGQEISLAISRGVLRQDPLTYIWQQVLSAQYFSPKLRITSLRLNSPQTLSGWQVRKTDLDGRISVAAVLNAYTSPSWDQPPLVGTWDFYPSNIGEIIAPPGGPGAPDTISVYMTMRCDI